MVKNTMEKYTPYFESIEIPLERGDSFLWGKFKNRSAIFDHIEQDDKGQDIIVTDKGKKIPFLKIRLVKESKLKEEHFSPFKAWYFPDKDEFIKFSTYKDHREFVDNYVDTMKLGAVRIHAFDSQVEIETKENLDIGHKIELEHVEYDTGNKVVKEIIKLLSHKIVMDHSSEDIDYYSKNINFKDELKQEGK